MRQVRLLIADRRPLAASGLAAAFKDAVEFIVQARCHETGALSKLLGSAGNIEVAIIDVELFDGDASRAVDAIRVLDDAVALLLLTTHIDESLLEALTRDGVACVSAYSEGRSILSALRALLSGQPLLPFEVQRALMSRWGHPTPPPPPALTSREEQVLELAATGLTISQIAARLHISHSTAKTHLLRVYEKLGAPNRSAAVANAVALGMLRVSIPAA